MPVPPAAQAPPASSGIDSMLEAASGKRGMTSSIPVPWECRQDDLLAGEDVRQFGAVSAPQRLFFALPYPTAPGAGDASRSRPSVRPSPSFAAGDRLAGLRQTRPIALADHSTWREVCSAAITCSLLATFPYSDRGRCCSYTS